MSADRKHAFTGWRKRDGYWFGRCRCAWITEPALTLPEAVRAWPAYVEHFESATLRRWPGYSKQEEPA